MFPTASIEEFRFNIPDISFLQGLLSRYSCRLEDLLYISDDPAFLSNSIGSFVRTIYIGRFRWLDYGKLPDMALPSVSKLAAYIESGISLLGERIASLIQSMSLS